MHKHIRFSSAYEKETVDVNPVDTELSAAPAGLLLGPPGLADLHPSRPQICSVLLSSKPPTPSGHQTKPRPGGFLPSSFQYDGPFAQVAQRKVMMMRRSNPPGWKSRLCLRPPHLSVGMLSA